MEKDFDSWNSKKKETHKTEKKKIFYEREVWWCILGVNVGVEMDGKHEFFLRPVIVVRKFNKDMSIVAPTTAQDKNNKYYLSVSGEDGKTYNICLSQIRNVSSKRLLRKIGTVKETDYRVLLDKISNMIKGSL